MHTYVWIRLFVGWYIAVCVYIYMHIYILEICNLEGIKIRDLPAVTVDQSVECRRDNPGVRILASV